MWWGPQIEASPSPVIFHRNPTGASANPSSSPEPSSPPSVHPFCRSTHPKRLNLYHGIASNVSSESLPPDAAAIRSLVNANRGKESHKDFKTPNLKKKRNGAINLCQLEISPVRNGINDLTRIPKELQPFSGATVAMLSHNWPSLTTIREMRSWPSRQNLIQHWTRIFFFFTFKWLQFRCQQRRNIQERKCLDLLRFLFLPLLLLLLLSKRKKTEMCQLVALIDS